jgi:hypothetical protein
MKRHLAMIFSVAGSLLFLFPNYGLAAGFMSPMPAPYANDLAHLLFFGAMIFFIYEILKLGLEKSQGFRYLLWAWVLLALWNLDAFAGHWIIRSITGPLIWGKGWSMRLQVHDFQTWIIFITQINDFILLVPSFYFFYRGIKALAKMPSTDHQ